jgi:hypothetical protein
LSWLFHVVNSNIKIESKFENMNDLKIKVIHPTRSVGLEGAFTGGDEKNAKMVVTWDEDKNQAVGMEVKWQDQNRQHKQIFTLSITGRDSCSVPEYPLLSGVISVRTDTFLYIVFYWYQIEMHMSIFNLKIFCFYTTANCIMIWVCGHLSV